MDSAGIFVVWKFVKILCQVANHFESKWDCLDPNKILSQQVEAVNFFSSAQKKLDKDALPANA